jgi:HD-GYP domain-containing protein (c-di-GMP phosphodiesterase class II)
VAESYDAMTNDRPYRLRMTPSHAAAVLRQGRSSQWDAQVVDALLRTLSDEIETSVAPALRILRDVEPREERG